MLFDPMVFTNRDNGMGAEFVGQICQWCNAVAFDISIIIRSSILGRQATDQHVA